MHEIVKTFPDCQLNADMFGLILKAYESQVKTIPEINFVDFMQESGVFVNFKSRRELFEKIYEGLAKFVDSENIYKVTQFIRRVFDDSPEFEQEVTWEFIL